MAILHWSILELTVSVIKRATAHYTCDIAYGYTVIGAFSHYTQSELEGYLF